MAKASKKRKARKATGVTRMKQLGHRPCQVWFDRSERELVDAAAMADRRPVATFVRLAAIDRAKAMIGGATPEGQP